MHRRFAEESNESDRVVRQIIRQELPTGAFEKSLWRLLYFVPLVALIAGGSVLVATVSMPWYLALVVSILVGHFYGCLMFFGHELGHGAIVRSPILQEFLLYPCCLIFCFSPRLWRAWHNNSHHVYANHEFNDPDNFGTIEALQGQPWLRFAVNLHPGSGHWLSSLYLFVFFTTQAQVVLWFRSRNLPGYERLNRKRAILDSALMLSFWLTLCILGGLWTTLFVVLIPMLVANFLVMSYVVTNHMVRPLTNNPDTLRSTMSVRTFKALDRIHFFFSHHVEHHLFPSISSNYYPLIRKILLRHFYTEYACPSHRLALRTVFETPRVHDGFDTLIDAESDHRVELGDLHKTFLVQKSS